MNIAELQSKLSAVNQSSVLRFWDQLSPASQSKLSSQLAALDLAHLPALIKDYVQNKPHIPLPASIQPVKAFPTTPTPDLADYYKKALIRGQELIAQGAVAAFLVAGGQGTRLGYDGPKGEYPVTPIRHKPLFQVFAEQILARGRQFNTVIHWYIMTSDVNDAPTRAFFAKNNHFGLNPKQVHFFQQGMMPAFSNDGQLLLADKDSLALSPDGHGGSLRALQKSGALAEMKSLGVQHLSYFQVDNPLVQCIDPLFIGLHDLTGSEMSSKTITKATPSEKVGNFCIGDGKLQVIEYSDLPESLALEVLSDGTPKFNAASIGIHILTVSFVERLNAGGQLQLPWHRAEKKVPYVDQNGAPIKPQSTNAVKLEQFVFDAIPLAQNAMVYTTQRLEDFSPVKNATGPDSPETCTAHQIQRNANWLRSAGVEIPIKNGKPDATLEISPLFALCADDLKFKKLPKEIPAGAKLLLE